MMRPKIVEENIDNFNAVTKDAIARLVKIKESCGPDEHIPDLEGEMKRWATEGKSLKCHTCFVCHFVDATFKALSPYFLFLIFLFFSQIKRLFCRKFYDMARYFYM